MTKKYDFSNFWFLAVYKTMDDDCMEIEEQRPVAAAGSSYMLVSVPMFHKLFVKRNATIEY